MINQNDTSYYTKQFVILTLKTFIVNPQWCFLYSSFFQIALLRLSFEFIESFLCSGCFNYQHDITHFYCHQVNTFGHLKVNHVTREMYLIYPSLGNFILNSFVRETLDNIGLRNKPKSVVGKLSRLDGLTVLAKEKQFI